MTHQRCRLFLIASLGILVVAAAAFGSPVTETPKHFDAGTDLRQDSERPSPERGILSTSLDEQPGNSAKGIKLKVTAEIANVRVKPFIGSNIVRQFPESTILEAELKEGEWFLVKIEPDETGTVSGYVHESLVEVLEEIPAEASVPAPVAPPPVEKTQETTPPAAIPAPKTEEIKPVKKKPAVYEATQEILADAAAESPAYVFLWGGGGLTAVGDLNAGAEGLADYYAAQLNRTADSAVAPVRTGLQFGGELGLSIVPGFRIAVGAEYLRAEKESALAFSGDAEIPASFTVKPAFSALPVHVSLVYYPLDFVYIKAGVGYFFARAKYRYVFAHGDTLRDWQGEANAGGAGLLGGIGVDLSLARHFYLTAEISGRYAKISGFSGTDTFRDENNSAEPYVETGKLYAYDARNSSPTAYSLVFIRDKKPLESGVENAKEASLDLSGLSLRVGFKYKF
ncbi:MAG: hypothetical protein NTW38_00725 [Candidatus Aminicenantes bacterium]|nr:hypothetical protein [Candidatus Aminicenantes bacterium]